MAPALHISHSWILNNFNTGAPTWNPCVILLFCTTLVFERVRLQMESLLHGHEGLHDERLRTLMLCFGMGLFHAIPTSTCFKRLFGHEKSIEILGSNMIWTSFYHGPKWSAPDGQTHPASPRRAIWGSLFYQRSWNMGIAEDWRNNNRETKRITN